MKPGADFGSSPLRSNRMSGWLGSSSPVAGFSRAAVLYFYAGDFAEARKMMEQAADVAEATGDMVAAAYRHVDAAFIAVWEGYPGKRREHVETAEKYAAEYAFEQDDAERISALTRGVASLPVDENN